MKPSSSYIAGFILQLSEIYLFDDLLAEQIQHYFTYPLEKVNRIINVINENRHNPRLLIKIKYEINREKHEEMIRSLSI